MIPYHRASEIDINVDVIALAVQNRQNQRKLSQLNYTLQILLFVSLHFIFSSFFSILNKALTSSKYGIHSTTISFAEVAFNMVADMLFLSCQCFDSKWQHLSLPKLVPIFGPIAVCSVLARLFTILGYGRIPVSLVHTIKALMPLFSLIINWLFLRKVFPVGVYFSVIPIVSGVVLSSFSDADFNISGLTCTTLSTFFATLMNFLTKQRMIDGMDKMNIHLYNSITSVLLLLPIFLFNEYQAPSALSVVQASLLLVTCLIGFLSSVMSIYTVSLVSTLSYAVISNIKRVYVILFSVWYYHSPLKFENYIGVILTLIGALSYNIVTLYNSGELPFISLSTMDRDI